eukprot:2984134-Rhodomonas_salina.1
MSRVSGLRCMGIEDLGSDNALDGGEEGFAVPDLAVADRNLEILDNLRTLPVIAEGTLHVIRVAAVGGLHVAGFSQTQEKLWCVMICTLSVVRGSERTLSSCRLATRCVF